MKEDLFKNSAAPLTWESAWTYVLFSFCLVLNFVQKKMIYIQNELKCHALRKKHNMVTEQNNKKEWKTKTRCIKLLWTTKIDMKNEDRGCKS